MKHQTLFGEKLTWNWMFWTSWREGFLTWKSWFQCLGCAKINVQHSNSDQKNSPKVFSKHLLYSNMSVKCLLHVSENNLQLFFGCRWSMFLHKLTQAKAGPTVLMVKMIWILRTRMHYCALAAKMPKAGKKHIFMFHVFFALFFFCNLLRFWKTFGRSFLVYQVILVGGLWNTISDFGPCFHSPCLWKNGHVNCELAGNCQVFR